MTTYSDETPITRELLTGAIAIELKREPVNVERVGLYARALQSLIESED